MASLPSLEAVARELEDLIKPGGTVEVAELTQAGVLRETRENAAAEAVSIAQSQLSDYSVCVALPSLFMESAARWRVIADKTGSGLQAIIPIPTTSYPPPPCPSDRSPTSRRWRS